MVSAPYKFRGKLFRYDFDDGIVEYICKATREMIADNEEWQSRHGCDLWDIDKDGYHVLDSAGLCKENWVCKESRDSYLKSWMDAYEDECDALVKSFVRNELPQLIGEVPIR